MSVIDMKENVIECSKVDADSEPNDIICLLDDEEDTFQQYKEKSKQILHDLLDADPQNEYKFIETLEKYRLLLETQVDNVSNKYLKEAATNDIIYITINYKKITALYVDNYLDVMEEILIILCDVIKNYFKKIESFTTKIIKKESRKIKMLLQWSLLERLDRVMHLFLRMQISIDVHEYKLLWADIFRYYLCRVFRYHRNEEIVGGYIIYQKLKDLTPKKESAKIDLCVYRTLGKSGDELRRIPILKEIIEKRETDPLYSARDMCVQYYRYYKRKCNDVFRVSYKHQGIKPITLFDEGHSSIFDNSPPFYSILSKSSSRFDRILTQRKTIFDPVTKQDTSVIHTDNTIIVLDDEDSDDDVLIISESSKDSIEHAIESTSVHEEESFETPPTPQPEITDTSMHVNEECTDVGNGEDEPPDKYLEVLNNNNSLIDNGEPETLEKTGSIHDDVTQETDGTNCYIESNFEYPSYNSTLINEFNDEHLDNVSDLALNEITEKMLSSYEDGESTKTPLPLKKRPVMDNPLSPALITTPMDLMHNISYPAERQMSIADLQNELPKIRTLAARKYYADNESHPAYESNYCSNSPQSIMDVYINGINQCSDYPICFMIGSMKTCLNHALTSNCHHKQQDFLSDQPSTPIDASQVIFTPPPVIDKKTLKRSLKARRTKSRKKEKSRTEQNIVENVMNLEYRTNNRR